MEVCVIQMKLLNESRRESSSGMLSSGLPPYIALVIVAAEFFTALEGFMIRCNQANTIYSGVGYRKLRLFSWTQPVLKGKDEFETWMEQAF